MKRQRRLTFKLMSAVLLAFAVLCGTMQTAAVDVKASEAGGQAADSKNYTYTVRFHSGQQGTFDGEQTTVAEENVRYNTYVVFNSNSVKLPDNSKYYVKGIRKAGRDNNTVDEVAPSAIPVTEDADYVVAYGIKGDMKKYTVNYVDAETGEALADPQEYYGNVGDKPVVAFLYIDGYQPQAYNLTKTLSENEADNVFTFEYTRIEGAAAPTPAPEGEAGGEGEGGDAAAGAAGAGAAAGGAGADAGLPLTEVPDEGVPLADGPQDLVDLDDQDVPLANLDLNGDGKPDGMFATGVRLGLIGASAALLGFLFFLFYKRRKQEKEAEAIVQDERDHDILD